VFRLVRYFEGKEGGAFVPAVYDVKQRYSNLLKHASLGLDDGDVRRGLFYFGRNLAYVPIKSHFQLLVDEILHPFYIFQVWSVVVWYLEPYIMYATAIALISLVSALVSLLSARKNLEKIQEMALFVCAVTCRRRNSEGVVESKVIESTELVPGDVVELEGNFTFPCDMVLCSGTCVVNESMLTGESLPVLKAAVPVFSGLGEEGRYSSQDKRFTLYCGTKCLEARRQGKDSPVLALVLRTGFSTAKGKLVRSILFPKPASFKMYADSFKFVGVMAFMATCGFLFSIHTFIKYKVDVWEIVLNACDVVTIAVPPALPAAMTIGTEFALERLKKAKIFCISPNRVNVCGELDMLCFDKTGTLTQEGVDVMGVMSVNDNVQLSQLQAPRNATLNMQKCLATCHGLTSVEGELVGDPLDLKMFESTQWTLEEPEGDQDTSLAPSVVYPPIDQAHPHFLHSLPVFSTHSASTVTPLMPLREEAHSPPISFAISQTPPSTPPLPQLTLQIPPRSPNTTRGLFGSWAGVNKFLSGDPKSPQLRGSAPSTPERGGRSSEGLDALPSELSLGAAASRGNAKQFGLAIVRRFEFTSVHQRMSVIVRSDSGRGSHVFLKGAPEAVRALCIPSSIPSNLQQVVHGLTRQGLRILACAYRHDEKLSWHASQRLTRDKAERDMQFLGLLLMENRLKKESAGVIATLKEAGIGCCMVTGDHVLTGVTVSRQCGLIDQTKSVFLADFEEEEDEEEVAERQRRKSWGGDSDDDSEVDYDGDGGFSQGRPNVRRSGVLSASNSARDLQVLEDTSERPEATGGVEVDRINTGRKKRIVFRPLEEEEDAPGANKFSCEAMIKMLQMDACRNWEVALTGSVFEALHREALESAGGDKLLDRFASRCTVFARMSPEQKQALVERFGEHHGHTVGMCGDGANDCGALKAAHVGLSLSDAEASIAAPFTSSTQNIRPLLTLMREGRAALVTSVSCFKFMALYSVIQFVTVIRLYHLNANMSDCQYLWIDLFMILPLAVYMARTGPARKLSVQRPQSRLISISVLSSVLGQSLIAALFQVFAASWTFQIKGFYCNDACPGPKFHDTCDPEELDIMPPCCAALPLGCPTRPIGVETDENVMSVEASSAFLFAQFQYLIVVICFNTSAPFRKSLTTNGLLFASWVMLSAISTFLLLSPEEWIAQIDELIPSLQIQRFPSPLFKWKLFGLALVNFACSYIFEILTEATVQRKEMGQFSRVAAVAMIVLMALLFSVGPLALVYSTMWVTA